MFKLSALNEKESDDSSNEEERRQKGTKEAQEVHAFNLYNKALQLQRDNQHQMAFAVYEQLLKTSLVTEAATTLVDTNGEASERPLKDPGLILKYSTHKNLATISADKGDINSAMEHYLEAVMLDTTDVTLWQRIGTHAITLDKLALARHAFTSGLKCNENYWPCLDSAITVLFAILDYENCLYWIAKALEKDPEYGKGLVLREKMYQHCPHLRRDTQQLFNHCDFSIYDNEVDEEEAKQYVDEGLELRERHRLACLPKPPKSVTVNPAVSALTWVILGKSLTATYEYITTTNDAQVSFPSKCIFQNVEQLKQRLETAKENEAAKKLRQVSSVHEEINKAKNALSSCEMSEDSVDSILGTGQTLFVSSPAATSMTFDLTASDNGGSSQDSMTQSGPLFRPLDIARESIVGEMLFDIIDEVASNRDVVECNPVHDLMEELLTTVCEDVEIKPKKRDSAVGEVMHNLLSEVVRSVDGDLTNVSFAGSKPGMSQNSALTCHKPRKAAKRKRNTLAEALEEHEKRRSTRVRVSSKKKQVLEVAAVPILQTDYRSKIARLLPVELTSIEIDLKSQGSSKSKAAQSLSDNTASDVKRSMVYEDLAEASDVLEFITSNQNKTIVSLMDNFCLILSTKVLMQLPSGTRETLLQVFARSQAHIQYNELEDLRSDEEKIRYREIVYNILSCVEAQIDCNEKKLKIQHGIAPGKLGNHLMYLVSALDHPSLFRSRGDYPHQDLSHFSLRLLCARSRHFEEHGLGEKAINDLNVCKEIIEKVVEPKQPKCETSGELQSFQLVLPNQKCSPTISLKAIDRRLDYLKSKQVLDDVKRMFESECYNDVIKMLGKTLKCTPEVSRNSERPRQIRQLLISHEKVGDVVGLVTSASFAMSEVILNAQISKTIMSGRETTSEKVTESKRSAKEWTMTLHVAVQITDRLVSMSPECLGQVSQGVRARLAQALVSAIGFVFSELDEGRSFLAKANSLNLAVLTWLLLYKLLKYEERDVDFLDPNLTELPTSFYLLDIAHQWTGERGLCCLSDGGLSRFIIKEYHIRFKRIRKNIRGSLASESSRMVEQCFCCLFGFPNKGKVRYLQDHNVKLTNPTWEDYLLMFEFFRPVPLPEFDSFKALSVSLEISQLLIRALSAVPHDLLAKVPNTEADVTAFIESDLDDVSASLKQHPVDGDSQVAMLGDMYYLLGDYNFKNNEMTKAVKYYTLDLRINPVRFDSWAGMALARSSQTDDRLRLCESKKSQHKISDSGTEKKGLVALLCFRRALNFESSNVKLRIEYGSHAYWMHALYSRRFKRGPTSSEHMDSALLQKKDTEMLATSRKAFEAVRECDSDEIYGEEWLIDYMLGKLAEKEGKPLKTFIPLYQSAAEILHRRQARYPKRIQPKYGTVNDMSVEALEMHFRVHASILKYLLARKIVNGDSVEYDVTEDDVVFMKDTVEEMSKSPFVHREEFKSSYNSSSVQDEDKQPSKLAATSESCDLTMGSLLPDSVLQALHLETDEKNDDQTPSSSAQSPDASTCGSTTLNEGPLDSQNTTASAEIKIESTATSYEDKSRNNTGRFEGGTQAQSKTSCDEFRHREHCLSIIDACESAFRLCLHRFPQHSKSIYHLARLYYDSEPKRKHLTWSRDLLYGCSSSWQQHWHMPAPGLLSDRNKTNLFNGVWRIPMDDIDRPGSFAFHLLRCVTLLIKVTHELRQHGTLLVLHNMLNRSPDHGRKYLRDDDRIFLAHLALVYCRSVLHTKVLNCSVLPKSRRIITNTLHNRGPPSSESFKSADGAESLRAQLSSKTVPIKERSSKMPLSVDAQNSSVENCLGLVLDAYKVYQDTQKHPDSTTKLDTSIDPCDVTHQRLLADAYHKYTCCVAKHSSNGDSSSETLQETLSDVQVTSTFEQAVRFCQRQNLMKKQTTSSAAKAPQVTSIHSTNNPPTTSAASGAHDDATRSDSGGATAAADHVKGLSIDDPDALAPADSTTATPVAAAANNNVVMSESGLNNPTQTEYKSTVNESAPSAGQQPKVMMVEKEGKKYTRIGLPSGNHTITPSPGSAFNPTRQGDGEIDSFNKKRIRVDPGLAHLELPISSSNLNGSTSKRSLVRSTSVPAANFMHDRDADAENKPPHCHRPIYRTGSSISEYTKDRLKKSILARTSAALVRKPSITEHEIMQIHGEAGAEYDSSSDEEEVEEMEDEVARSNKRKYGEDGPSSLVESTPVTSPLAAMQSTVITTAGST